MKNTEKALRLIEKAKTSKSNFLDLGNLGLTELPDELFELKNLEFLNIGSRYIKNFRPKKSINKEGLNIIKWIPWKIRKLSNLKSLSLHATYVGDISGLKELADLTYLDLGFGYFIRDYSFLKYMRNLEILNLHTNYIKELPLIGKFKKIRYLDLSFNNFKSIEFLKNLKKLEHLGIQGYSRDENKLDISNIQHLSNLKKINIASNFIANKEYFCKFKNLEDLNLFDTHTSNIDFIMGLKNLRKLNLWKNQIRDINALSNLKQIENLNLRENKINDIRPLKNLKKLTNLDLSFNKIENTNLGNEFNNLRYYKFNDNKFDKNKPL